MRTGTDRPRDFRGPLLLSAALMLSGGAAHAEEAEVRHFIDSNTERTPAVTAFPAYPSIARRDRLEGEATVCFIIDREGRVVRPRVRSSTHKIFERPSLRAIRKSRFEPLPTDKRPSPVRTCRTYRFRLERVSAAGAATSVSSFSV